MNEISKKLIEHARRNVERFISPRLRAAVVTGSAAKGYADEASDIDTLLFFDEKFNEDEFNRFVEDARFTGGNIHLGNQEDGFALYHIIDGIICDFAFIYCNNTENMFREAVEKPAEPIVHLQISGITDGVDLYGSDWVNSLREAAGNYPRELQVLVVKQHLKFHPKWALMKMGYERNDIMFINETCDLVDKHLPEVSTERTREIQKMILRK